MKLQRLPWGTVVVFGAALLIINICVAWFVYRAIFLSRRKNQILYIALVGIACIVILVLSAVEVTRSPQDRIRWERRNAPSWAYAPVSFETSSCVSLQLFGSAANWHHTNQSNNKSSALPDVVGIPHHFDVEVAIDIDCAEAENLETGLDGGIELLLQGPDHIVIKKSWSWEGHRLHSPARLNVTRWQFDIGGCGWYVI